jgi:hypothetical protein
MVLVDLSRNVYQTFTGQLSVIYSNVFRLRTTAIKCAQKLGDDVIYWCSAYIESVLVRSTRFLVLPVVLRSTPEYIFCTPVKIVFGQREY